MRLKLQWRAGRSVRATGTAAALAALALIAAAPAQGATSIHPGGGSDFAVDAQGWVGTDTSCNVNVGLLCSASTVHEPGVGNPAGSISTRVGVTLNLTGVFQGAGSWTSPAFTVPAGQQVTDATFAYDRQLDPGGLLDLQPKSTITVKLVDQTAGSTTTLQTETLDSSATSFARRGAGAPAGAVIAGHTYQLRIETTTTSTVVRVGLLGQTNTRFDNVVLAVGQASSGDGVGKGGPTPIVSAGVTIVRDALSTSQINSLFNRFNENTEVGRGPGGSLIPLAQCTIIGTARADRIKGTSGHDVICGLGGNDIIDGAGGIDIIDGANGNDRLKGGPAKDKLIALRGNDRLYGNAGNDRAGGGAGRDRVSGGSGADRLGGGTGKDRILGGTGRDRIRARDRTRDTVDGGKGRDRATVDRLRRGARTTRSALRRVDRVRGVERIR